MWKIVINIKFDWNLGKNETEVQLILQCYIFRLLLLMISLSQSFHVRYRHRFELIASNYARESCKLKLTIYSSIIINMKGAHPNERFTMLMAFDEQGLLTNLTSLITSSSTFHVERNLPERIQTIRRHFHGLGSEWEKNGRNFKF